MSDEFRPGSVQVTQDRPTSDGTITLTQEQFAELKARAGTDRQFADVALAAEGASPDFWDRAAAFVEKQRISRATGGASNLSESKRLLRAAMLSNPRFANPHDPDVSSIADDLAGDE